MVSHRSVMVHVTVTEPPSQSTGADAVALLSVSTGAHPFAMLNAAVCAVTQLLNAVSRSPCVA
ncbi:hypothetical protein [Flaviramulus aquimarinus]|uniref:hypothetical protein n=1 Tax=Flaviramulus aquimarinus TaxID=1170456 RepID=UPI0031EB0A74